MKKKLLAILFAVCAATLCAFGLAGCNLSDSQGDKPGVNIGGDTGDKPGGSTGDKPGGDTGDKPGGNIGDKPDGDTGDKPGGDQTHTSHSYDKKITESKYLKSEATCTGKAVYYFSCECGEYGTQTFESGEAKGHSEKDIPGIEPTCTEKGKTAGKRCWVCNTVTVVQTEIPAKGHTETDIQATEPTCTEKGLTTGKKCGVCNTVIIEQTEIPATGHKEVEIKGTEPTCTEKGKTAGKKCSVCNIITVTQTDIPANGHKEVTDNAVPATCTEKGKTAGKHCSVCNTVTVAQTDVPANGHKEVTDDAVPASCTKKGKTEGKHCSVCNTVTVAQTETPANGHTEVTDDAVPASCTKKGKTAGKHCSVCNTVIVAQTIIPANGHTEVTDNAVPATCTEKGKTEGTHCSVCNTVIVAQTILPANGHTETELEAKEPTCGQKGLTAGKKCSVCQTILVKQNDIPETGKHVVVLDPAVEATCTEYGKSEGKHCLICNKIILSQLIKDKLPHKTVVTQKKEPTCYEDGNIQYYTCTVCNKIYLSSYDTNAITAEQTVLKARHTFSDNYLFDETGHWRTAVCGHTVEITKYEHTFPEGDNVCYCKFVGESPELQFTLNAQGTAYTLTGLGNFKGKKLRIPATYNGLPVTAIAKSSIGAENYTSTKITDIIIPDSVTEIAKSAIWNCPSLINLTVPFVGNNDKASEFTQLSNIFAIKQQQPDIPATLRSITVKRGVIRAYAFSLFTSVTDIILPENLTKLNFTFNGLSSLKNIQNFPQNIKEIPDGMFSKCTSLTQFEIPASVTYIGSSAFADSGITALIIPETVTEIGWDAFANCAKLKKIHFPKSIRQLRKGVLAGCNSLEFLSVPFIGESRTEASNYGYLGYVFGANSCDTQNEYVPASLKTVAITDGHEIIAARAFYKCSNLTCVMLSKTITKVYGDAFQGCSIMRTVYYEGTAAEWKKMYIQGGNNMLSSALKYYYSEKAVSGYFWHYDTDGVTPVAW